MSETRDVWALAGKYDELVDENERLRAALRRVESSRYSGAIKSQIAREALDERIVLSDVVAREERSAVEGRGDG